MCKFTEFLVFLLHCNLYYFKRKEKKGKRKKTISKEISTVEKEHSLQHRTAFRLLLPGQGNTEGRKARQGRGIEGLLEPSISFLSIFHFTCFRSLGEREREKERERERDGYIYPHRF